MFSVFWPLWQACNDGGVNTHIHPGEGVVGLSDGEKLWNERETGCDIVVRVRVFCGGLFFFSRRDLIY